MHPYTAPLTPQRDACLRCGLPAEVHGRPIYVATDPTACVCGGINLRRIERTVETNGRPEQWQAYCQAPACLAWNYGPRRAASEGFAWRVAA